MACGGFVNDSFSEIENYLETDRFKSQIKTNKDMHGLYQIEGANIVLENWVSAFGGYALNRNEGSIVNDTTYDVNIANGSGVNYRYKFKPYSPKPDSTNKFIK